MKLIEEQNDSFNPITQKFTIEHYNKPDQQKKIGEDYILVDQLRGLVGVFDGIGSRDNGYRAAQVGAQTIRACWEDLYPRTYLAGRTSLALLLQNLIQQADKQISLLEIPSVQRRPATTVALAVLSSDNNQGSMTYAHVGDSRIYLLREGQKLQRLTEDDGYFLFALQKGWLSQEDCIRIEQAAEDTSLSDSDLGHFSKRNKVTCAVGWTDFEVHTSTINLCNDDRIVFCSDGIHDNLTDQEIEHDVREEPFAASAQRLVDSAYQRSQQEQRRSKQDDISAIVVRYLTDTFAL